MTPEEEMRHLADAMDHSDIVAMRLGEEETFFPTKFACFPVIAAVLGPDTQPESYALEFHAVSAETHKEQRFYILWPREEWPKFVAMINAEHFPNEPCTHLGGHG